MEREIYIAVLMPSWRIELMAVLRLKLGLCWGWGKQTQIAKYWVIVFDPDHVRILRACKQRGKR